ncbi:MULTISPECIES: terpene synthase family protein [Streptomyces]|uniref:terpene synthase family protein n=1 Tax=Streptomyces TaxID=1883 RepID=UPI001F2F94EA|nr:terpene synthase family protein [Streptomyces sp. A1-5]UJB40395.1 hypothetical protein HRD51_05665 [Streptomyces sp. A1-5]
MDSDVALRPEELTYRLPEMDLILPLRMHPMLPQAQYDTPAWVRSYVGDVAGTDVEEWLNAGYELWTCLCYPHAREDRILRMSRLCTVLTIVDDETTRDTPFGNSSAYAAAAVEQWEDLLRGTQPVPQEAPAWWRLAHDTWHDLTTDMPDGLRERFITYLMRILRGSVTEVAVREHATELDLDAYMELRRETVYGTYCWLLAEYALGLDFTDMFTEHPELFGVWQDASDHLIVFNDLISLRKEWFVECDDRMSASWILRRQHGFTVQEFADWTAARLAEIERSYVKRCQDILTTSWGNTPAMRAYLCEIGHTMAGSLFFSRSSARYHAPGLLWNGITEATMTMHPHRSTIAPVHHNRPDHRAPYLYLSPLAQGHECARSSTGARSQ